MKQPRLFTRLFAAMLLSVIAGQTLAFCNPFEPDTLPEIEVGLAKRYGDFAHWTPAFLQTRIEAKAPLLLLDVREREEFAVSHLPGAIRVDPSASSAEVQRLLGPLPAKAQVVFYCAVGSRSSRLAQRVGADLLARGAASIANLRGGIFAWHNAGLMATSDTGPTRFVHPYDDCRAKLLQPPYKATP